MTFGELQREMLQRSFVCGGAGSLTNDEKHLVAAELRQAGKPRDTTSNPVLVDQRKSSCLLAAATVVLAERGVEWAQANWEDFINDTLGRLGFWVSVALFFFGGAGLLWVLAKIILPILVDWLIEQEKAGVCSLAGGDAVLVGLANEASAYINEQRQLGRERGETFWK